MSIETIQKVAVPLYSLDGEVIGEIDLPSFFAMPVRKDLIKRGYLAIFTSRKQPQGRDPLAGKKVSVRSFGTGLELARVPRHVNGRAGFAPMTRGGYKPHPPRVEKKIIELINIKEKRLAFVSALAATSKKEFVKLRGHKFDQEKIKALPIIVKDDLETLEKTREASFFMQKIGVYNDILRVKKNTTIRAGKGKMRGRKLKKPVGPLVVVSSNNCSAIKAFRNIPGVDIVAVNLLNVAHLAPGGRAGRLTIFSESALKKLVERVNSYE